MEKFYIVVRHDDTKSQSIRMVEAIDCYNGVTYSDGLDMVFKFSDLKLAKSLADICNIIDPAYKSMVLEIKEVEN